MSGQTTDFWAIFRTDQSKGVTFSSKTHPLSSGVDADKRPCFPVFADVFLPCPDNLLVNLEESKELVMDLLNQLPAMFEHNMETGSALGAALQAAYKLMVSRCSGSGNLRIQVGEECVSGEKQ